MADDLNANATPVPAATATPPAAPVADKPKSKDRALPLAKKARKRMAKMLAGAQKHGMIQYFVGPLAIANVQKTLSDFDAAVTGTTVAAKGKQVTASDATRLTRQAEDVIAAIHDYADVFYGYGTEGRSLFWASIGTRNDVEAELAACIAGVTYDRTDRKGADGKVIKANKWIPANAETDLTALTQLQGDLHTAVTLAAAGHDDRETVANRRAALGEQVRQLVAPSEKLLRRLNKKTPELLPDFGIARR